MTLHHKTNKKSHIAQFYAMAKIGDLGQYWVIVRVLINSERAILLLCLGLIKVAIV